MYSLCWLKSTWIGELTSKKQQWREENQEQEKKEIHVAMFVRVESRLVSLEDPRTCQDPFPKRTSAGGAHHKTRYFLPLPLLPSLESRALLVKPQTRFANGKSHVSCTLLLLHDYIPT